MKYCQMKEAVDLCSSLRSAFEMSLEKSSEVIISHLNTSQYSK